MRVGPLDFPQSFIDLTVLADGKEHALPAAGLGAYSPASRICSSASSATCLC